MVRKGTHARFFVALLLLGSAMEFHAGTSAAEPVPAAWRTSASRNSSISK